MTTPGHATRVLIVDDDDIALELLAHTLAAGGYEVETASSGDEAALKLAAGDAHIVITDWEMPGMSGVELCRHIRQRECDSYVYVILLTGRNSREEVVEGLSAGADDFVAKPFHPEELICRVHTGERVLSLETREVAIFALAKLAESRDTDTGKHLERVQNFSRILAQQLAANSTYRDQIDGEFVRLVYLTSPLHDIGKVGIPDAVLLKPGGLSDDEFEVMKTHVTIGASTLDAALARYPGTRFLRMARDIAESHHERWDGRGYPHGLSGTQIPLAARIVALADVYDALTSRRVYKGAFSHAIAKGIILKDTGTHFDPVVVRAFLSAEQEFVSVRERFSDGVQETEEKESHLLSSATGAN